MDATLVATLTTLPANGFEDGLEDVAWLEVRADLIGDLHPEPLRARFPGKLLYTLRSRAEGGSWEGSNERRKRRLLDAAERYDLIDLECTRDLTPDVLRAIPESKRVISWHGPAVDLAGLKAIFEKMSAFDALLYKIVPTASQSGEEIPALLLLDSLKRRDVAAFSVGPTGAWTRLVAPRLGAPVIYGALGDVPGAPGQITLRRLREDFGLPALPPVQKLFGVVGNPVLHSLSPRLHNTAYRELGLPFLYLPFHAESFGDFWLEVIEGGALEQIGMPLRGLSVTTPHKEAALAVAAAPSPRAELIGAANTLVNPQEVWEAETTDPEGVVLPLQARGIDLSTRRAAVVGAGGAGRAAAEGLAVAGAQVTLVNRSPENGQRAAGLLKIPFLSLDEFDPSAFDLIVHATSLGRSVDDPLPFPIEDLHPGTVVVDLVYLSDRDEPTPLLAAAEARGLTTVDGREVLVYQALGQFRWMTGREMPLAAALRIVGLAEAPEDLP